ncbi:hypothetical protein [Streptomyces sp. NPDC051014]|uniref:hypothetical protein n=1 Tax=Streptomyces sp. NPDC051014 TaxID=3155751 RepID=UPI00340895CF
MSFIVSQPLDYANSAAGLIMTMMSEVGGKLDVSVSTTADMNSIPSQFLNSAKRNNKSLGVYTVSGCWFTHTRLYRTARIFGGVNSGRKLVDNALEANFEARGRQSKEVEESHLVGTQMPFAMNFEVISYELDDFAVELAASATAPMSNMGLAAENFDLRLKQISKQMEKYRPGSGRYRDLKKDYDKVAAAFEEQSRRVAKISADGLRRARKASRSDTQYAIVNFRLTPLDVSGTGVKKYASAGISVTGSLSANPIPGTGIDISLDWNERGLPFYHKSWTGEFQLTLDDRGYPEVTATAPNKFFSRFMATMTKIETVDPRDRPGRNATANVESKEQMRLDRQRIEERDRFREREAREAREAEREEERRHRQNGRDRVNRALDETRAERERLRDKSPIRDARDAGSWGRVRPDEERAASPRRDGGGGRGPGSSSRDGDGGRGAASSSRDGRRDDWRVDSPRRDGDGGRGAASSSRDGRRDDWRVDSPRRDGDGGRGAASSPRDGRRGESRNR